MKRVLVSIAAIAAAFLVPGDSASAGDRNKNKEKAERSCHAEKNSEGSCNRSGNDDCRDAKAPCSDDDLSPDIRDSEIYICAVPRSCPRQDRSDERERDAQPDTDGQPDEEEDEYAPAAG